MIQYTRAGVVLMEWFSGFRSPPCLRPACPVHQTHPIMAKKYDDLTREELIRLIEARDQRDATRFGLVWEANEIERDITGPFRIADAAAY